MAFGVLADGYPSATAAACCRELARGAGAAGMVGGQVEDLAWEKRGAHWKTWSRSQPQDWRALPGLLRLGVLVAQGERPGGARCDAAGQSRRLWPLFRLAFQITDDLLDVQGHAEQTGKRVQKDAARGKLTYPGFLGVAESRRRAERLCREACEHLQFLGTAGDRLAALPGPLWSAIGSP